MQKIIKVLGHEGGEGEHPHRTGAEPLGQSPGHRDDHRDGQQICAVDPLHGGDGRVEGAGHVRQRDGDHRHVQHRGDSAGDDNGTELEYGSVEARNGRGFAH